MKERIRRKPYRRTQNFEENPEIAVGMESSDTFSMRATPDLAQSDCLDVGEDSDMITLS